MEDKDLIEGCINKDRRSQNALYEKYFPLMSSIALRYTNNQDEALQGLNFGFYKVLTNLKKYNDAYALSTFIRTILINHFIDEFRKKTKLRSVEVELDEVTIDLATDSNLAEQKWNEEVLQHLLDQLPPVTKTVFSLFAIDGYKHKEIAEKLGCSEGTSKWHVNEARKKLKQGLTTLNTSTNSVQVKP